MWQTSHEEAIRMIGAAKSGRTKDEQDAVITSHKGYLIFLNVEAPHR